MKTHFLLPAMAAFAMSLHAQSPGGPPPPPPHRDPASPGPNPDAPKQDDRREHFRKMAEQFRHRHGPGHHGQPQGKPLEREEHLSEAIKHLRAAGLGEMAQRIEGEIKKRVGDGRGPAAADAPRRPDGPPPQRPHPPGPDRAFGKPAPLPPAMSQRRESHPQPQASGGGEDLRAQVQRLSRQVEELGNMIRGRTAGPQTDRGRGDQHHPRPHAEPRKEGERRPDADQKRDGDRRPPQADQPKRPDGAREQHRDAPPQRRPEGDRPSGERRDAPPEQRRPEGDRPPGDRRDAPPQPRREGDRPEPKRDGAAEEVKPAQPEQSGSVE